VSVSGRYNPHVQLPPQSRFEEATVLIMAHRGALDSDASPGNLMSSQLHKLPARQCSKSYRWFQQIASPVIAFLSGVCLCNKIKHQFQENSPTVPANNVIGCSINFTWSAYATEKSSTSSRKTHQLF
jgi:hypothetical protein